MRNKYKNDIKLLTNHYEKPLTNDKYEITRWIMRILTNKIPYENISKILKDRYIKEYRKESDKFRFPDELIGEHIEKHFGGTCFSVTYTLSHILDYFGICNNIVMGDMRVGENVHCAVVMELNGNRYLLDPGYMISEPIPITDDGESYIKTQSHDIILKKNKENGKQDLYTVGSKGNAVLRLGFHNDFVDDDTFKKYWEESFSRDTMDAVMVEYLSDAGLYYFRKNHVVHTSQGKKSNYVFEKEDDIASFIEEFYGINKNYIHEAHRALTERKLSVENK